MSKFVSVDVLERGSVWRKWDLHIHTPISFHWTGKRLGMGDDDAVLLEVAQALQSADVATFAVMDYWTFDGFIALREYLKRFPTMTAKRILPGMEFRMEAPTAYRLNTHVLLSDEVSDEKMRHFVSKLQVTGRIGPPTRETFIQIGRSMPLDKASIHGFCEEQRSDDEAMKRLGEITAQITRESLKEAIQFIGEENCLIYQPFDTSDGAAKLDWKTHMLDDLDILRQADIFEAKNPQTIDLMLGKGALPDLQTSFFDTIGGAPKPVSRGSDAHEIANYGKFPGGKITWMKADPSFAGLRQICCEPAARCHIGELPPKLKHIAENPTKYIASIRVEKVAGATTSDEWFNGVDLPLNPGLIAIVGNKGSGKTALADVIALAGNSKAPRYEFLTKERFRKSKQTAESFRAVITWCDGTESERLLSEDYDADMPERVRYLPQSAIENLCNEIAETGGVAFDKELKKVIFSHVEPKDRLNQESLDDLIAYRSDSANERISQLRGEIQSLCSDIVAMQRQIAPNAKAELANAIKLKESEIQAHDEVNPGPPVAPPDMKETDQGQDLIQQVTAEQTKLATVQEDTTAKEKESAALTSRTAVLQRIEGKIGNFEASFQSFKRELGAELDEVGLNFEDVISFKADRTKLAALETKTQLAIAQVNLLLHGGEGQQSRAQLENAIKETIGALQAQLQGPLKEYQASLAKHTEWQNRRKVLVGDAQTLASLEHLKWQVRQKEEVIPKQLVAAKEQRWELVKQVFALLDEIRATYALLYRPIQDMARSYTSIENALAIEFRAFLAVDNFVEKFLAHFNQGRKGSFYGSEEGRQRLKDTVYEYDLSGFDDLRQFLERVNFLSTHDVGHDDAPVSIESQLVKSSTEEALTTWLYSLDYLCPRYTLQMGGKDIAQLSPGEKGALLLVFYLLLDNQEIPIIIDQPEHNLDNESVVELLSDCIRQARERRQVVIVTHNPNLAVYCDAEQIVCSRFGKEPSYKFVYFSGSLEHPAVNERVVQVLEGTYPAFNNRKKKYREQKIR